MFPKERSRTNVLRSKRLYSVPYDVVADLTVGQELIEDPLKVHQVLPQLLQNGKQCHALSVFVCVCVCAVCVRVWVLTAHFRYTCLSCVSTSLHTNCRYIYRHACMVRSSCYS